MVHEHGVHIAKIMGKTAILYITENIFFYIIPEIDKKIDL